MRRIDTRWWRLMVCALVVGVVCGAQAQSPTTLDVGTFSAATVGGPWPSGWTPLTFESIPARTRYSLVEDGGQVVVKAVAEASAGGLIRAQAIDPKAFPIVRWRWKVMNLLDKGDVTKKSGDDYPARLYITFAYDPSRATLFEAAKYKLARAIFGKDLPFRALNYIWDRRTAKGRIVANPYTDWTMMVVVESGPDGVGTWIDEERNVYEDYRRAFNEEPRPISGVAIMTDTDNTGETATAYYGDIQFRAAP